ncbi:MAG: class II aldolase/adducin family protein [Peptococcaceae bacterium]|nr:class II aldolase/adducin family protein [Peptococcaceae bacterium]
MTGKSEEIKNLRQQLVEVGKRVYRRGLTSGLSGNISARLKSCPHEILIKASGKCLEDLKPNDFIHLDWDGNIIEGESKPSVEVLFHCGIYKARPEVYGIVHGHAPYCTAYVMAKGGLPVVTAAAEIDLEKVGIIQYAEPGSAELAGYVTEAFRDKALKAAVLQGHGFVTVGPDIFQAYYLADVLEDNAKAALILDVLGK